MQLENLVLEELSEAEIQAHMAVIRNKMALGWSRNPTILMSALLKTHPYIQSIEQLVKAFDWPDLHSNDNLIECYVSRIRGKLEDTKLEGEYCINTLPEFGYWLDIKTAEGQARLEFLRRTSLHEAPNATALAQIAFLNGIKLSRHSAKLLYALFENAPGTVVHYDKLEEAIIGEANEPISLDARDKDISGLRSSIGRLRSSTMGRQINGWTYAIKTSIGVGCSIEVQAVNR